jgi:hypothetical protein
MRRVRDFPDEAQDQIGSRCRGLNSSCGAEYQTASNVAYVSQIEVE